MKKVNHEDLMSLKNVLKKNEGAMLYMLNRLNDCGMLSEYQNKIQEISSTEFIDRRAYGKLVVIGDLRIKKDVMFAIGSKYGIYKNRFEVVDDYVDAKSYQVSKMRNSSNYAVVIVARVPHKTAEIGDYSSLVSHMRNTPGYPEVYHIKELSKSSFTNLIEQLLADSKIAA